MKKLLPIFLILYVLFVETELLAQESFSDLEIFELNISDNETVFSPTVLNISTTEIELIVVSSEKNNDQSEISRKFKKVDLNKIFNLQKIIIENKAPYRIISKELLSNKINTSYQEGPVSFNEREKKLFFTRSSENISKNKRLLLDIYEVDYLNGQYQVPKKINLFPDQISVMHPSFDFENSMIYFASNFDNTNKYDLYFSKINSNGEFESPKKVPNVNSSSNEAFPFIFKNILFFASNRESDFGGYDIYFSKIENGEYQAPKLLPSPINTNFDDFSFSISDSLKYGFFSSNRVKDSLDICYLIPFKPLEGKNDAYKYASFNSGVFENKSVLVNDSIQDKLFPFSDSYEAIVVQKPQKGELELNSDGTFTYSSNDEEVKKDHFTYKISDGYRQSNPIVVNLSRMETEVLLRPIYYDFAKFNLIEKYKPRLDSIADFMKLDSTFNLIVSSSTDARGSFISNRKLSESRSKTIMKYLIENKGIDKKRLLIKDLGEEHLKGNIFADYLIEVFKDSDLKAVNKKLTEFSSYNPFIYENNNQSYSLILEQFDTKKQSLKFIRKLERKNIQSRLILNNFVNVSEEEHKKNRKTTFKMLLKTEEK